MICSHKRTIWRVCLICSGNRRVTRCQHVHHCREPLVQACKGGLNILLSKPHLSEQPRGAARVFCQSPLWGLRACEAISLFSVCQHVKSEIASYLAMTTLSCQSPLGGLRACEAISLFSVCHHVKGEIASYLAMTKPALHQLFACLFWD